MSEKTDNTDTQPSSETNETDSKDTLKQPSETENVSALENDIDADNDESEMVIPVASQGIVAEFFDFIVHNKAWWMTPIILVLLFFVAIILFAESAPVLPFIYTVL